jgi:molecular chaperone DnaK
MTYGLSIDVGTTFTAAAIWRDGRAKVVPLGDRSNTVPSVLFLRDDGVMLVGEGANRRAITEPDRVAREFKRRLGDRVPVRLGDQDLTPQALMAAMLGWVVQTVRDREGALPARVVLTCPANWGGYRRELLLEAARTAGVGEVELMAEPIAAAAWYASQERVEPGAVVAIYDLGGGTFDAAVVRKTEGGFELVGEPGGDDTLGGVDFDQQVMEHVAATLGDRWTGLDQADPLTAQAVAQVRANAVEAKEALSSDVEAAISVVVPGTSRQVRLTRVELEEMVREPLRATVAALRRALQAASVTPDALHAVLLVGGSSRIPLVAELLAGELGVPVAADAHPKFAVCLGAALATGVHLQAPAPGPAVGTTEETGAAVPAAGAGDGDPPAAGPIPQRRRRALPRRQVLLVAAAVAVVLVAVATSLVFLREPAPTGDVVSPTTLPATTQSTSPSTTTSSSTSSTTTTRPVATTRRSVVPPPTRRPPPTSGPTSSETTVPPTVTEPPTTTPPQTTT